MSSLISNVLVGVGKQVWNAFTEEGGKQVSRSDQLQQFNERLDFAVNPEKATFKQFLSDNFIHSMNGVEFLSQKLKNGLLSDPELSQFLQGNGGIDADIEIEKKGSNYVLTSASGQEWVVQSNSSLENKVDQLYRLESIKQLAALQPGLDLDHLVDAAFQLSNPSSLQ